jgi:hypothetical protein
MPWSARPVVTPGASRQVCLRVIGPFWNVQVLEPVRHSRLESAVKGSRRWTLQWRNVRQLTGGDSTPSTCRS